ncbi:hypothetical protein [Erythrobacter sp. EC-HK427]|uniref:hypothetical protein n=1 Tax=Erythrobacter sp. EC-HK427 TaxID=2038396 RepID=UPI00125250DB|nr:hypothetical protein [Erythrobacter sp. EC-HK427]VVT20253.1 conserved hypothetical protein [Erythrobacter sp. EC-HK427]
MSDRYDGKPFLRLLDSYVLDAIGALDDANAAWLTASEPHLRATYGGEGSWQAIVAAQMQFPAGMQDAIRQLWESGRARFAAAGQGEPDPVMFAITFVDQKFPH